MRHRVQEFLKKLRHHCPYCYKPIEPGQARERTNKGWAHQSCMRYDPDRKGTASLRGATN